MRIKSEIFFYLDVLLKKIFYIFINILWKGMSHRNFPDLLESLCSFEISQKLTTKKTGKKCVKKRMVLKIFAMKSMGFFRNEVGI